jgi:hypothetical protein
MANSDRDKKAEEWLEMRPHDEFLELCAVSTAGDLTGEEQTRLRAHLAGCPECRQALKDFEIARPCCLRGYPQSLPTDRCHPEVLRTMLRR